MPKVFLPSGVTRPVLFSKPTGALDAGATAEYFGRSSSNSARTIADLKALPGFPVSIKPFGATGQEFWNIEELDEFRLKHCPRSNSFQSTRKWSETDPRRLRANARRAARMAAAAGAQEMVQ